MTRNIEPGLERKVLRAKLDGAHTTTMGELIQRRYNEPFQPGIKVNLYRDYEYRAMARAVAALPMCHIESVMVGDSYFMTHLGRSSTQLDRATSLHALELLPRLIAEVRAEIDRNLYGIQKPLLMADVPDGLTRQEILDILDAFKQAGADIVKLELHSDADLWIVEETRSTGMSPAVHLGYMPQKNENKTYGTNLDEIRAYAASVTRAAKLGAECVVFERITEVANQILTHHALQVGVLPYSIFSGRAAMGGQSLNAWDSVVMSSQPSIFFPPTALITREEVEARYDEELIAACLGKMLRLMLANVFPPSPRAKIEIDSYMAIIDQCVVGRRFVGELADRERLAMIAGV